MNNLTNVMYNFFYNAMPSMPFGNWSGWTGQTPLVQLKEDLSKGDAAAIQARIDNTGTSDIVSFRCEDGGNALHLAVTSGNKECVLLVAQVKGVDLRLKNRSGKFASDLARALDNKKLGEELGAALDSLAARRCANSEDLIGLQLILEHCECDLFARNSKGDCVMDFAVRNRNNILCNYLMDTLNRPIRHLAPEDNAKIAPPFRFLEIPFQILSKKPQSVLVIGPGYDPKFKGSFQLSEIVLAAPQGAKITVIEPNPTAVEELRKDFVPAVFGHCEESFFRVEDPRAKEFMARLGGHEVNFDLTLVKSGIAEYVPSSSERYEVIVATHSIRYALHGASQDEIDRICGSVFGMLTENGTLFVDRFVGYYFLLGQALGNPVFADLDVKFYNQPMGWEGTLLPHMKISLPPEEVAVVTKNPKPFRF